MLFLVNGSVYNPERDNANHRDAMEKMAAAWRRRAAEEERIANLVLAVDQIISAPINSPSAERRGKYFHDLLYQLAWSFLFGRWQPKFDLAALKYVQRRDE